MHTDLTNVEIGKRIIYYRKLKGLSQKELAMILDISRPVLAQIELGNRKISATELIKLANNLGFSLDSLFAEDFNPVNLGFTDTEEGKAERTQVRISIPELNVKKFKNVLLYVLERCSGKPNVGETVLYKLLYFIDFNYYEKYEEQLTGASYRKLPYGPVPQNIDDILNIMIENKELKRVKTEFHNYPQTRYLPLIKPDLNELKASEKETIDQVINLLSDYYAKAISDYSHKDLPWLATEDGEEIDYELAFYREQPYSVRNYDD